MIGLLNKDSYLLQFVTIADGIVKKAKFLSSNIYLDSMQMDIVVDGNIGSGKTSLVEIIKDAIDDNIICDNMVTIHSYSINEQIDKNDELFQNYCKNRKKYAFQFQKWIIKNKEKQLEAIKDKIRKVDELMDYGKNLHVILWDRSIISDHVIFCLKQHKDGFISNNQYSSYLHLIKEISREHKNFVGADMIVFLNPPIKTCMERIKKRSRKGEECYTRKYIGVLHDKYRKLYKGSEIIMIPDVIELKIIKKEFSKLFN